MEDTGFTLLVIMLKDIALKPICIDVMIQNRLLWKMPKGVNIITAVIFLRKVLHFLL